MSIFIFFMCFPTSDADDFMYKDLWNMERLTSFKKGDFSYFYRLDQSQKIKVSLIYTFISELDGSNDTNIFKFCKVETDKYLQILCMWKYFMHCLNSTDTKRDKNPCNPFFKEVCFLVIPLRPTTTTTSTTTMSTITTTSSFNWNSTTPESDNVSDNTPIFSTFTDEPTGAQMNATHTKSTKTSTMTPKTTTEYFNYTSFVRKSVVLKDESFDWNQTMLHGLDPEIPLTLFNLYLCTLSDYRYMCPDICIGQSNLCTNISDLHSPECFSSNVWNDRIQALKDPTRPDMGFDSLVYSCDCNHGFTWAFNAKACSFGGLFPNPCNPVTQAPCNEEGTTICVGDNYSGDFFCRCKPQYVGSLCETLIDACVMDIVSLDGDTLEEVTNAAGSYTSGYEMCKVNMSGISIRKSPNQCIPVLGTRKYHCVCYYPFLEDLEYKVSNCINRETACYNELCVNGACKETESGDDSICVCDVEYEGQMCDRKITQWSHWSECSPECGTGRSRYRDRESYNKVKYIQTEYCADRIEGDCPISQYQRTRLTLPFTNDELKFYSYYFLTTIIGIIGLSIIMHFSQLVTTPKFVGARQREREKNKSRRSIEKQKFSLWKVEQLQKDME